jgi:hypothetical protein
MAKKRSKSKKVASTTISKPAEALESKISVLESNPDAEVVEVRRESEVKVKALIPFYDLEAKMERGAGAEWEVSESRAELLKKLGIAIVL